MWNHFLWPSTSFSQHTGIYRWVLEQWPKREQFGAWDEICWGWSIAALTGTTRAACHPGVTPGSLPPRYPAQVLGVPPSPPNATSTPRASEGIDFPPRPRRDVNSLSSSLNFPLLGVPVPPAPRCRACGGKPRRLEAPGSSSAIIQCDRNTLTRRPRCLRLICIANSI